MSKLLGMPEAAKRATISPRSIQRALARAEVPLVQINQRAWAVEEEALQKFMDGRVEIGYSGRGRPTGSKSQKRKGQTMNTKGDETENELP